MKRRQRARWRDRRRPSAAGLATLVLVLGLLAGCGGSGGGGGDDGDDSGVCLDFSPTPTEATGSVSATKGANSTCALLEVDLWVTDVDDVFGLGFEGTLDPLVATFTGTSDVGTFLRSDGGVAISGGDSPAPGEMRAGIIRQGETTGVDAVGSEYAMTMIFQRTGTSGSSEIGITQAGIAGPPPAPGENPVEIPGIPFTLGSIFIVVQ